MECAAPAELPGIAGAVGLSAPRRLVIAYSQDSLERGRCCLSPAGSCRMEAADARVARNSSGRGRRKHAKHNREERKKPGHVLIHFLAMPEVNPTFG